MSLLKMMLIRNAIKNLVRSYTLDDSHINQLISLDSENDADHDVMESKSNLR